MRDDDDSPHPPSALVPAPPPAPPAPPAPVADIGASVDISSKTMNPPTYPPEERRRGVQGQVMLVITVDANGNPTDVQVEHSSGNRNLDREAVKAAKRWRFTPALRNGQKTGGRVRVPVDFVLR
jgi:protein TonB